MPGWLSDEGTAQVLRCSVGDIYCNVAGEGPDLILLHGSGPGATGWSNFGGNVQKLARKFRCIVPDMPGWGRSVSVTGSQRDHVADINEVMVALGITRAAVVGNSMGGATGIRLAASHPDRVSHLITMGAVAPGLRYFTAGGGPTDGIRIVREAYADPSCEVMATMTEVFAFSPDFVTDELVLERSRQASSRQDHLDNFLADPDMRRKSATIEQVQSIQVPTLVMHGRDDRVVPMEHALVLLSLIPDSRACIVSQCGHWLMLEHPEEFNRRVADFVLNHPGAL